MPKPLMAELFAGLHGWGEGGLAHGYQVIGYDIVDMCKELGKPRPEGIELVIQDVLTIHGSQFKNASLIVASPPCTEFSFMAMPWKRGKQIAAALRGKGEFPVGYKGSRTIKELTALFDACFRIQREASEAAGRYIPLVVENVRGAQPWVGRARWAWGSFYLWGDVPALMPIPGKVRKTPEGSWDTTRKNYNADHSWEGTKLPGNNGPRLWSERETQRLCDAYKSSGLNWSDRSKRGQDFTRVAGQQSEGVKVASGEGRRTDVGKGARFTSRDCGNEGVKGFTPQGQPLGKNEFARKFGSKSLKRKEASAVIAKIPFSLASWLAKCFYPRNEQTKNSGHIRKCDQSLDANKRDEVALRPPNL